MLCIWLVGVQECVSMCVSVCAHCSRAHPLRQVSHPYGEKQSHRFISLLLLLSCSFSFSPVLSLSLALSSSLLVSPLNSASGSFSPSPSFPVSWLLHGSYV